MPRKRELTFHLDVLVERKSPALWVAHCLQLDLVAEAATSKAAFEELLNLVDAQIRTCVENDNLDNLYFPAPKEVWNKLAQIKRAAGSCRYERRLRPAPIDIDSYDRMEVDQFCYA